jgi:hypothetical protein
VAAFDDVLDVFDSRTAHHLPKPRPPSAGHEKAPAR